MGLYIYNISTTGVSNVKHVFHNTHTHTCTHLFSQHVTTQHICNIKKFDQDPQRKKRRTAAQAAFEKAQGVYDDARQWSFDNQWASRMKPKEFSDFSGKVLTQGRAASNIVDNSNAASLGENLFIIESELCRRQDLIIEMRDAFVGFMLRPLTTLEIKTLESASEKVIVQIINNNLNVCIEKLVKGKDEKSLSDNLGAIIACLVRRETKGHFGLSFVSPSTCQESVGTTTSEQLKNLKHMFNQFCIVVVTREKCPIIQFG